MQCTILHLITVLQSSRSISHYEYYQKYHQYLFYKAKTLWLNCSFWKNTILVWLKYNASTNYQYHLFSNNINMAILQDTENPNHTSKFLKIKNKKERKKKKPFTTLNSINFLTSFSLYFPQWFTCSSSLIAELLSGETSALYLHHLYHINKELHTT